MRLSPANTHRLHYYLLLSVVFGALVLAGYRWLTRHVQRAGLVYGGFLLAVVAPLIVVGDTVAIENGILAMGGGIHSVAVAFAVRFPDSSNCERAVRLLDL